MTKPNTSRANLVCQNNKIALTGCLDFQTVGTLYEVSLAYLRPNESFQIDFSGIESVNSAGLALIVEWVRLGRQIPCQIKFINIPENLAAIARVADLAEVL